MYNIQYIYNTLCYVRTLLQLFFIICPNFPWEAIKEINFPLADDVSGEGVRMLQTTRQYKHGLVVLVPSTKVTFPVYATVFTVHWTGHCL